MYFGLELERKVPNFELSSEPSFDEPSSELTGNKEDGVAYFTVPMAMQYLVRTDLRIVSVRSHHQHHTSSSERCRTLLTEEKTMMDCYFLPLGLPLFICFAISQHLLFLTPIEAFQPTLSKRGLPTCIRRIPSPLFLEQPTPGNEPFHVATTTDTNGNTVHTLTFPSLPHQGNQPPLELSTGAIGRLAAGAVTLTRGDTVLYTTAARDDEPNPNIDFVPLSVEHQERFSSAGLTSGAFHKRDGRPAEHEILTARLIDRPLRPLLPDGWRRETQVLSWVLSFDNESSVAPLAITAAAAAVAISDIPLKRPVAAVQVGMVEDPLSETDEPKFVVNPTKEQMASSPLLLTVAGTEDAVLMIEGEANFLPEAAFLEAVRLGHEAVTTLCQGLHALAVAKGPEKLFDSVQQPPEGLFELVAARMTERIDTMLAASGSKKEKGLLQHEVQQAALAEIPEAYGEEVSESAILGAFKTLLKQRMFARVQQEGLRYDGRRVDEVRQLHMETSILPRVHGSALFTRGETQAIATATLGDSGMRQKMDTIGGMEEKRFYLQYTFPPSCVGETGRVGMPGRREVGHGNLAERALAPTLPSEKDFPYTIRVESLITESHGSSSMASVCGGCLALIDAGVPVERPVAGIAMGMLMGDKSDVSEENTIVLTDITGTEDALGMMDFKVAGDRTGVTSFQLDIKCEGLSLEIMERALEQARIGRLHILDAMEKTKSKSELPDTVPRLHSFSVPVDTLGKVIGPGGRQIRSIIEEFKLTNMDVGEDGTIQVSSLDSDQLTKAAKFVQDLVAGPPSGAGGGGGPRNTLPPYNGTALVEGETYTGKITGIHRFGVFVEIIPPPEDGSTQGVEGLCHVSELAIEHVRNCEGYINARGFEELTVKYLGKDKRGKVSLSRKAVLESGRSVRTTRSGPRNRETGKDTPKSTAPSNKELPATMSQGELDAISQAIENIV